MHANKRTRRAAASAALVQLDSGKQLPAELAGVRRDRGIDTTVRAEGVTFRTHKLRKHSLREKSFRKRSFRKQRFCAKNY